MSRYVLLLLFANAAGFGQQADFENANRLYEQGKFAESAIVYNQLLQQGRKSADLYFNLGNAYFKAGEFGHAVAAYRHAQMLAPRDPDVRFNLRFVREKISGAEPREKWQAMLRRLTVNEWTLLAAGVYWLLGGLLILQEIRPRARLIVRPYLVPLGIVVAAFLSIACYNHVEANRTHEAVVVVPNAVVRRGPLEESPVSFQLPNGSEVRVLDKKQLTIGDRQQLWLQVQDGRGIGWLQHDQVILLQPGDGKIIGS